MNGMATSSSVTCATMAWKRQCRARLHAAAGCHGEFKWQRQGQWDLRTRLRSRSGARIGEGFVNTVVDEQMLEEAAAQKLKIDPETVAPIANALKEERRRLHLSADCCGRISGCDRVALGDLARVVENRAAPGRIPLARRACAPVRGGVSPEVGPAGASNETHLQHRSASDESTTTRRYHRRLMWRRFDYHGRDGGFADLHRRNLSPSSPAAS